LLLCKKWRMRLEQIASGRTVLAADSRHNVTAILNYVSIKATIHTIYMEN